MSAPRTSRRRPWVAAVGAALLAAGPAPGTAPVRGAVSLGVASALEKLRPGSPFPQGRAIELAAARGECESAQVAVRADRPILALTARAPPLRGPSPVSTALYRVATLELSRPSGSDGESGAWPDPLLPERDAYFGEPRRAFPVAVPAGQVQAIWIEVCVPQDARPGLRRGAVVLAEGRAEIGEVPITVDVWPFALPATATHPVTFGLPTRVGTRALGRPDDPELARALAAAALRHRVSPHGLSYDPPAGTCTAARCELDFRSYDAEMAPILDGTLVQGVHGTFADVRVTARDWAAPQADLVALFRAWREHFDRRGWSDRLWLYTLDEPKPGDLSELARRARAAHAGGVRVFVTSVPIPALDGLVDAYAPNVFFFDRLAGEGLRARGRDASPGRSFWYASCMSHGCDEPPGAGPARREMSRAFSGLPGYEIDRPGAAARAMGWLAFRERLAGELYYDMLHAWSGDPWKDVRAFAGNGDGTLLYPGLPDRLGGSHPFPVESIRLKLVRDGIEDWEMLSLAERSGLSSLARRLAARLAPSVRGFERDPGPYLAAHRELGAALAAKLGRE